MGCTWGNLTWFCLIEFLFYEIKVGNCNLKLSIYCDFVFSNETFLLLEWGLERSDGGIGEQKDWPCPFSLKNQRWTRGCGWLHDSLSWIWHRHHCGQKNRNNLSDSVSRSVNSAQFFSLFTWNHAILWGAIFSRFLLWLARYEKLLWINKSAFWHQNHFDIFEVVLFGTCFRGNSKHIIF